MKIVILKKFFKIILKHREKSKEEEIEKNLEKCQFILIQYQQKSKK